MSMLFRWRFLFTIAAAAQLLCAPAGAQDAKPYSALKILGLDNAAGGSGGVPYLGLRDDLYVRLDAPGHVDPTGFVLWLDGYPMKGLAARYDEVRHALYFRLERLEGREKDNREEWVRILGAPYSWSRPVRVDVTPPKAADGTDAVPLAYAGPGRAQFDLILVRPDFIWAPVLAILVVVWAIVRWGTKKTLLRDGTVPTIEPTRRMYSLGRSQMAFWFILILTSYLFIFAITWDYNSLTGQTLALMGIAAATALGAVAIDRNKDTSDMRAVRAAEEAVAREAGFVIDSADDIARARARANDPATPNAANLQAALRVFDAAIVPFTTKGSWWRDVVSDESGPALHRFQILVWTIVLGVIFLIGVHRDLAMPEFSESLLALMGISAGTYLGFKLPEK
jgi:hypothetical protein